MILLYTPGHGKFFQVPVQSRFAGRSQMAQAIHLFLTAPDPVAPTHSRDAHLPETIEIRGLYRDARLIISRKIRASIPMPKDLLCEPAKHSRFVDTLYRPPPPGQESWDRAAH